MRQAEQVSRQLKLRHLRVLAAVIEQRSMMKAAEQLAVSQPVVSKAMSDLENILGVRLLDRGPQGVEPTAYGRALLRHSVSIFDGLRAGISELAFLADPGAGELKIGTTELMATTLVPAIIDRLARYYPRLTVEVVIASPAGLRDRELRGRRVDLIVGPFRPDDAELDVTTLYRDRLNIVTGKTNPLARRRKVTLAELTHARWALPASDHIIGSFVIDLFRRAGLQPPRGFVTVTSAPFMSRLLTGGQFVGVLGSVFLEFSGGRSSIKVLPIDLPAHPWPVSIATLKDRALNPTVKLFVDAAQALAKPLAQADSQRRAPAR